MREVFLTRAEYRYQYKRTGLLPHPVKQNLLGKKQEPHNWKKYHLLLTAKEDVKGGDFVSC